MDSKSTIFIFGAALIFIVPLVISCKPECVDDFRQRRGCESDEYCHMEDARCVPLSGYTYYDDIACPGYFIDGDRMKDTLEDAVNTCNQDGECGCIYKVKGRRGDDYALCKGTETNLSPGNEAWVKT